MKRTELQVGAELYHAKPGDWRDDYTSHPGRRVRVVSVDPHRSFSDEPIKTNTGNGVLVDVLDEQTGKPKSWRWGTGYVVQLGHLRGPYAETLAKVEQERTAKREATLRAKAQRDADRGVMDALVARAQAAGLLSVWARDTNTVSMRIEDLATVLDKLDHLRRGGA